MPPANVHSDRIRAYRAAEATRTESDREEQVLRHLPLVHSVVERIAAHLPPQVDREDLFHAGVIGLMDALDRFDTGRDNSFSTYAVLRIRGAVIDELRARDWVPRGRRQKAREYQQAVHELHHQLGRLPEPAELAQQLGLDEGELLDLERDVQLACQISLDAPVGEDGSIGQIVASSDTAWENPALRLEGEDRRRVLLSALEDLKEQERLILKMYYFENMLMKEIAAVVGVTESRVCQIHARLMALLRGRLRTIGVTD